MEIGDESIEDSELTEEQLIIKEKVERIFKENNWNPQTINSISVESDQNNDLKAIINHDEENFILKNIWVREDLRGTGYTQEVLKRVFQKYNFMFVWEPNLSFIKAMIKADLGSYKKIQRMDIWFLIPQMLSDLSNGFISRYDYIIKKNGYYYIMGTAPDNTTIFVNQLYKELDDNLTKEGLKMISKGTEAIIKKTNLIWRRCIAEQKNLVQEYSKNWTDAKKMTYQDKLERFKEFMTKNFDKSVQEYEDIKKEGKFIDIN